MHALFFTAWTHCHCGNHSIAKAQLDELVVLADEKSSLFWKTLGMLTQRCALPLTGESTRTRSHDYLRNQGLPVHGGNVVGAVMGIVFGQGLCRHRPIRRRLALVSNEYGANNQGKVVRGGGPSHGKEIALKSPTPDLAMAEAYFEHALAVAREQRAKSWELRAATSMARLWRAQGERQQARDLLAPIFGWFTEGFDTLDLGESQRGCSTTWLYDRACSRRGRIRWADLAPNR